MHLNPHAYFYAALRDVDFMFFGNTANPFSTYPAGCQNHVVSGVGTLIGDNSSHSLLFNDDIDYFLGVMKNDSLAFDILRHFRDMIGEIITAKMLLLDEQQIDAHLAGILAYFLSFRHICRKNVSIHVKPIINLFGFIDERFGLGNLHELEQISFAEFMDEIEFTI